MKKTLFFLVGLCALIIAGCTEPEPPTAEITAVTALIAETSDTEATFTLTTTREWSISTTEQWITSITPNSGTEPAANDTITISFSANDGNVRNAVITITSVDKTHEITLSQAAGEPIAVLGQVYLYKATLAKDPNGFNLLSDPGFEDYTNVDTPHFSPWWLQDSQYSTVNPHSGTRSVECNIDQISTNLSFQTFAAKMHTNYVLTAYMKSNQDTGTPDTYVGIRKSIEGRPVLKDVNKGMNLSTNWSQETVEFNSAEFPVLEAFAFAFQKGGYKLYWDDICVKPAGYTSDSYLFDDVTSMGSIFPALNGVLTSADGCTVWDGGSGKTMIAFGKCVGLGDKKTLSNALATSTDENLSDGMTAEVVKDGTQAKELLTPETGKNIIPTAGVSVGTRQYMHYQISSDKESTETIWTIEKSGIAYSEDNGETWTKSSVEWGANSNFAQVSFLKDDGYVYMYGSTAGRRIDGVEQYIRLARAAEADIATQSAWKYWDGANWSENIDSAIPVVYGGTVGEISVVKNEQTDRYMMLYFSVKRNAIVLRDAAAPEGEWSGEKIVMDDSASEVLSNPSFHAIGASGNDVYFLVSSVLGE